MLSTIIGVLWIILGLFWLFRPEALKNRLKRKMNRRMKLTVYIFVLVFGVLLIGSVFKVRGILPKVIGIIGMLITIKVITLITSKTSEKFLEWWEGRPIVFFRVWALCMLAIGTALLFM